MKTIDVIQSRVERIGAGVADRLSALKSSAAVAKTRKAVRRGTEQTVKWVRKNPAVWPLAGLGGALATWLLVRSRRKARPQALQRAMSLVGPGVRKGFGAAVGRFLAWALSPRKPHVFRAISIRW
jgi:hypothetical protein